MSEVKPWLYISSHLMDLTKNLTHITYTYLPREDNQLIDSLGKLALMVNIPSGIHLMQLTMEMRLS